MLKEVTALVLALLGTSHATGDTVTIHGCGHTNLPKPDVACDAHCEEVTIPTAFKSKWDAVAWKYPGYTAGACSDHFNVKESEWDDYDFPKHGVQHIKKGYAPPAIATEDAWVSSPNDMMLMHTNTPANDPHHTHCEDVSADMSAVVSTNILDDISAHIYIYIYIYVGPYID